MAASVTSPARAPCDDEEQKGRDQRCRADHDVAVDGHHVQEFGAVEQRRSRHGEPPAQKPPGDRETEDEAAGLRDDGRSGRARDAPVQREHQHHRQRHA